MLFACGIEPVKLLELRHPARAIMTGHLIRFRSDQFDPVAFRQHDIAFPKEIQGSVRTRQAEFFCGRLAARSALKDLGLAMVHIGVGKHREPLWPSDVAGSITHNRHYACAVAIGAPGGAGIGIDIETIATGDALAAIEQTVLCKDELDLLGRVGAELPMATLISLSFSAKESFFKAAFGEVRQYFDFDAVSVVAIDLDARRITLCVRRPLSERLQAGATRDAYYDLLDEETIMTTCRWEYFNASAGCTSGILLSN